jgi:cellulose synthase/poly-beta-1,6-N-acetylglucosamine synthase-like glycosyltransferase
MIGLVSLLLLALAIPVAATSIYLLLLTLLSKAAAPPATSSRQLRFDVLVPAHDEAATIEAAVASLRALAWPADRFRILVVADNCTDDTASLARAAGAEVLARRDSTRHGKGYALEYGFARSAAHGWADAVVVVDADTAVSPNLLEAMAIRIELGASAVQVHYGVRNAQASWRTRLMTVAMAAFHQVRSRARERLRLSCGLRGNGWCVTHRLLRSVPYRAYSLAEDLEFGIDLGLAGHRVHYADEARVSADMVSGAAAAGTQRLRWEQGRRALILSRTWPLLQRAMRPHGKVCLDLAIDLLVLPLSYVVVALVALLLLAAGASAWQAVMVFWLWVGLACVTALACYVLRGWQLSGIGLRGLQDLARVPVFVLWKLLLLVRAPESGGWVRTSRERH